MEKTFNPSDEEYKSMEDIPSEHYAEFTEVGEGDGDGFVRTEAYDHQMEAAAIAEMANLVNETHLGATDVLHAEAMLDNAEVDRLAEEKRSLLESGSFDLNDKNISPKLRGDREVVLAAMEHDTDAFEYASPELKNDREFVLDAVRMDSWSLRYASAELRNDYAFALDVVAIKGKALQFLSQELQGNKEVVLAAVKQDGCALEYANSDLRADNGIVLNALRQNPSAIKYVDSGLRAKIEEALK